MKRLLIKVGIIGIIVTFSAASFIFSAEAEKKKFTYTLTSMGQVISKTTVSPSNVPKHELIQQVVMRSKQEINISDPNLLYKEAWLYGQEDSTAGSGSHRGHVIHVFEDGDRFYGQYEGIHKTVIKEDGSWEGTWEGKFQFTGGTGKFKNIKGGGAYKGKATPKEPFFEEGGGEVEY
jgi:hypothetical protein